MLPALIILLSANPTSLYAESTFPYTQRNHGYSGISTTVRGDIRTIGMAGSLVGLADTFIASGENPAGLAMTLPNIAVQFSANQVHDQNVQDYDQPLLTGNGGIAANFYPWGYSFGVWSPESEGQKYLLAPSQTPVNAGVFVQEYRVSVARLMWNEKLSLGLGLLLGKSKESLEFTNSPDSSVSQTAYAISGNFGVMIKFPQRWLLGVSVSLPLSISAPSQDSTSGISQFFQDVQSPFRLGMGLGWIPNRFFRVGMALYLMGTSQNTALLSDDSKPVGKYITLQPRLGVEYKLAEYKELEISAKIGTYYELSRIQDTKNRMHITGGLEIDPWIFSLGWGLDYGVGYQNYIYTAGLDIIKIAKKLDLIPQGWHPPTGGFLPPPLQMSDEGLARPLVENWKEHPENLSVLEIGKAIPKRIHERLKRTGSDLKGLGENLLDAIESVPNQIEEQIKKVIEDGAPKRSK